LSWIHWEFLSSVDGWPGAGRSPWSFGICMTTREKILEIGVATLLLSCLVWAMGMTIFVSGLRAGELDRVRDSMNTFSPLLLTFALITCVVLILWVLWRRGLESRLWNWLPPFVFFRGFGKAGRALMVGLLILGTVLGIVAERLGL
jgi:hypothetical protein